MLAVFQGIREGVGCTTIAASVSWHLSRFRQRVFATAVAGAIDGFRSVYNLPTNSENDNISTIWSYNERLVLFCPNQQTTTPPRQTIKALIESILDKGYSDTVVDVGHICSAETKVWLSYADVVITVCQADHNTLLRLSQYKPTDNEFLLLNKVEGNSEAARMATRHIRELKHLSDKVLSLVVPQDEYVAQASFMNGPVVQLAAFAESARVMSALGTWLTLYERKRS